MLKEACDCCPMTAAFEGSAYILGRKFDECGNGAELGLASAICDEFTGFDPASKKLRAADL